MLVARIRPEVRATGAELVPSGIQLVGYVHRPGDRATVRCLTAPWVESIACAITADGLIDVPDDAGIAGGLVIDIVEDRGWAEPSTEWPEAGLLVHRDGFRYSADQAERQISRMLGEPHAGHQLLPRSDLGQVWMTLSLMDHVVSEADRVIIEAELRRALQLLPAKSRDALSKLDVSATLAADLLQRARLSSPSEPITERVVTAGDPPVKAPTDHDTINELRRLPGEWYVASVYERREMMVKAKLESRVGVHGLTDQIYKVAVPAPPPTESAPVTLVRRAPKKPSHPYAGYLLVCMDLNDETYGLVRNTEGVTNFKSSMGTWPNPIDFDEVITILGLNARQPAMEPTSLDAPRYQRGAPVMVLNGPFATYPGTVDEVDLGDRKLRVLVNAFGRETPTRLSFDDVELVKRPA